MECIKIQGLTFTYPEQTHRALNDVNFTVNQGDFVTIVGKSGCGKSTLLRQLKTALAPHGTQQGKIFFEGRELSTISNREQSARIGFVQQNPDNQIVTDKVWHELAFGLESLGIDTPTIRGRVAEMTSFFGIQTWFYKDVTELSGGQKQLLNLASVMAMQPSVLILDEPTSQLDPIAASDFLATVGKINRELGTTVIMTEHRLEEVFPMSNRVIVMEDGGIVCDGRPEMVGEKLRECGNHMFLFMPTPMRVYAAVKCDGRCPVTVRDGRLWLDQYAREHDVKAPANYVQKKAFRSSVPIVELKDVWFKYDKNLSDVLRGLTFNIYSGELLAILGGNGTGKTTALSVISGINKPYRGKVFIEGSEIESGKVLYDGLLGVLPQNPQALFVKKTVGEDLGEILKKQKLTTKEKEERIAYAVRLCQLENLLERHPYDLSGGEQQRAALAKVLILKPKILLLDEPTKGLDAEFKGVFAQIIHKLLHIGVAVVMVSHDIEFCAKNADRCAMFFDGTIVTEGEPHKFFSGNSFYTTSVNRMARHLLPSVVNAEELIEACGGTVPSPMELPAGHMTMLAPPEIPTKLMEVGNDISGTELSPFTLSGEKTVGVAGGVTGMSNRSKKPIKNQQVSTGQCKFSKRTVVATGIILLAIPVTIFIGIFLLGDRKYYFISLMILIETMLPFFILFEGRKPQARELIIISVLCALGVAGRAAFFMLPQFKPVMAIVIISGVAFGGESGFLVGAVTMLVSNMMYGQGPWTPWQMFAMGVIGFLAGVLFHRGVLRRRRLPLCIFGGLAAVIIYGGLMNPAFVIQSNNHPTWSMILAAYLAGFPYDLVHAAATVTFLWLLSDSMFEKLDRIKVKYGLVDKN